MHASGLAAVCILSLSCLSASGLAAAQPAPPARRPVLVVPLLDEPARVDGVLDDPAWERAAVAGEFVQLEPSAGQPAVESTEVRVFRTAEALFVGARLSARDPARIVASEFVRDADLEGNDTFEIFLDTFRDRRNAFYFATNPVGAQRDALIRNEGEAVNWEWDGIWHVATSRNESGWIAEFAIPFSTLRFPPRSPEGWGANFGRLVARTRESSFWAPLSRDWGFNAKWRASAYGRLDGIEPGDRKGRLQLKPFALGGVEQDFEDSTGARDPTGSIGLDAKVAVSQTLTADVSVNTDFAQVESDQQQVNLTRFPLFYPEKREFFLENAGLFQIGERARPFEPPTTLLFFSRSIGLTEDGDQVPLYGGLRTTGKVGRYDLGIMDIVSKETVIDPDTRVPDANIFAARVKRDILARSSVGGFFFSKAPADEGTSNQVAGADATITVGSSFLVNAVGAKSVTPGLTGSSHAAILEADYSTDRLGIAGGYTDIGDDFNAELGFLQRTGIRKLRGSVFLGRRPGRLNLRQLLVGTDFTYIEDRQGRLQSQVGAVVLPLIFNNGSFLVGEWINQAEGLTESFEIRDGVEIPVGSYRFNQALVMFRGDRSRRISVNGLLVAGGFYGGTLGSYSIGTLVRPIDRLTLGLDYTRNNLDLPIEGGRYSTNLVVARAVFAFSARAFLRALVQSNDDEEEAAANILFRYTYRPGADLFVVYNEERGIRGATPPVKGRSLIVKLTVVAIPF